MDIDIECKNISTLFDIWWGVAILSFEESESVIRKTFALAYPKPLTVGQVYQHKTLRFWSRKVLKLLIYDIKVSSFFSPLVLQEPSSKLYYSNSITYLLSITSLLT